MSYVLGGGLANLYKVSLEKKEKSMGAKMWHYPRQFCTDSCKECLKVIVGRFPIDLYLSLRLDIF